MVDGKELRLGNVVRCMHHLPIGFNTPAMVYSRVIEVRETTIETTEGFFKFKDVGPVQITVEILTKCGVTRKSDHEFVFPKTHARRPDVELLEETGLYYLKNSNGEKYSIPFEYLHQLQNLYYALTGSDFKINL